MTTSVNTQIAGGGGGGTWGSITGTLSSQSDLAGALGQTDPWASYPALASAAPSVGTPTVTISESGVSSFSANGTQGPVYGEDHGWHQPRIVSLSDGRVAIAHINTRLVRSGGSIPVDRLQAIVSERSAAGVWSNQYGSAASTNSILAADIADDWMLVNDETNKAYHLVSAFGCYNETVQFGSVSFPYDGSAAVKSLATGFDQDDSGNTIAHPNSSRYFSVGAGPDGTVLARMSVDDPSGTGNTINASSRFISGKYVRGTGIVWGTPVQYQIGTRCGYPFVYPGALGQAASFVCSMQPNPYWQDARPGLPTDPGGDTYVFHGGIVDSHGTHLFAGDHQRSWGCGPGQMKYSYSSSDIFKRLRHEVLDHANFRLLSLVLVSQMQGLADGIYLCSRSLLGEGAKLQLVTAGADYIGRGAELVITGNGSIYILWDAGIASPTANSHTRFYVTPVTEPKKANVFAFGTPVNIGASLPAFTSPAGCSFRTTQSGSALRSNYVDLIFYTTDLALPVASTASPYPYATTSSGINEVTINFVRVQFY